MNTLFINFLFGCKRGKQMRAFCFLWGRQNPKTKGEYAEQGGHDYANCMKIFKNQAFQFFFLTWGLNIYYASKFFICCINAARPLGHYDGPRIIVDHR